MFIFLPPHLASSCFLPLHTSREIINLCFRKKKKSLGINLPSIDFLDLSFVSLSLSLFHFHLRNKGRISVTEYILKNLPIGIFKTPACKDHRCKATRDAVLVLKMVTPLLGIYTVGWAQKN